MGAKEDRQPGRTPLSKAPPAKSPADSKPGVGKRTLPSKEHTHRSKHWVDYGKFLATDDNGKIIVESVARAAVILAQKRHFKDPAKPRFQIPPSSPIGIRKNDRVFPAPKDPAWFSRLGEHSIVLRADVSTQVKDSLHLLAITLYVQAKPIGTPHFEADEVVFKIPATFMDIPIEDEDVSPEHNSPALGA